MITNWIKMTAVSAIALGTFGLFLTSAFGAPSAEEKKQIDELKKTYPLNVCVVSGEKLEKTSMGEPIDYLYTQKKDGKETVRLVRFCCPSCIKKFTKDPDKYLKLIDDEQAKKTVTTPASDKSPATNNMGGMHEHQH